MLLSLFRLPHVSVLRAPVGAVQPRFFTTSSPVLKAAAAAASASATKTKSAAPKKKATAKKTGAAKKKAAAPKKPKVKELTLTQLKEKEKPKRPLTSFVLYYQEHFKQHYTGTNDVTQAISEASKAWRAEADAVKETYRVKAAEKSKDYNKLKEEWEAKYKRPLSGYTKYIKSTIDRSKCATIQDASEQMKQLAAKWSTFTPQEKESWKTKEL